MERLSELDKFIRQQKALIEKEKQEQRKWAVISEKEKKNHVSPRVLEEKTGVEDFVCIETQPEKDENQSSIADGRENALATIEQCFGEKMSQEWATDTFYAYFPSLNPESRREKEARRREYEQYLKEASGIGCKTTKSKPSKKQTGVKENQNPVLDSRRMEKDKLASKLQTSNHKSILNYQIVEARNRKVQEEQLQRKQQYNEELQQQIEEKRRQLAEIKARDKLEEEILNRKIELDLQQEEIEKHKQLERQAQLRKVQNMAINNSSNVEKRPQKLPNRRKAQSENGLDNLESQPKENQVYKFFSNSARNYKSSVNLPETSVDEKGFCQNCESLLKAKFRFVPTICVKCRDLEEFTVCPKHVSSKQCLFCVQEENVKRCYLCDDHKETNIYENKSDNGDFDEEIDHLRFSNPKPYSFRNEKASRSNFEQLEDSEIDETFSKITNYYGSMMDKKKPRKSVTSNHDEIPLPLPDNKYLDRINQPTTKAIKPNEMKRVEWKWNVPVVQTTRVAEKPEKVLTQLGAIRKQLQIEHLQIDD